MSVLNSITNSARTRPVRTAVFGIGGVVLIAAAAFIAVLLLRDDSQASAQSANQLEFQVERGDITTSISVGGTSVFPVSSEVSFASAGTVETVAVEAGDIVQEGDLIARLDDSTIATLQVAQVSAEIALADAQAVYDKAETGATSRAEIAAAEEAVAVAEIALTAAQDALFDVSVADGVDGEAVESARSDVAFAERDLEAAVEALDEQLNSSTVADSASAVTDAEDAYRDVLLRWFGVAPEGFATMTLDEILEAWDVTLVDIYGVYADQHLESETPWLDNTETPWNEVTIWTLTSMSRNIVDPEAESSNHSTIFAPLGEIEDAWDALENAREAHDAEVAFSESAVLAAEKEVSRAEEALAAATDSLTSLLDPALLTARQASLDAALASLEQARISLEQAEANSAAIMSDAESRLELAQQNLADATEALESATLVSPIEGTVLIVNFESGDEVNPSNIVAEIADTSSVAVESSVDEEDILSIDVGLPVSVSLDALPGQTFNGTVTSVGHAEQSQAGAVSFPVTMTLDSTAGLDLVEGLTASAQIISSQVTDVLMVPVAAVGGSIFEPTVDVATSGGTETVTVQLGSSNGIFVEVTSGLDEGDSVMATIAGDIGLPSTEQTFFPGGGGFGGGGGGGGGGFRGGGQ